MEQQTIPYSYIAIEGNIGAGKTTLATMLAEQFDCRLILEQFTDNPFLPYFYNEPDRYAFPLELFFMTERYKQLQSMLPQQELFSDLTISDYFYTKTLLFARNNLKDEEYRMFQKMFHTLSSAFPKPQIILYLHRKVDNLLDNIQKRGRQFEAPITSEYLKKIQNVYFDYFRVETSIPIVILDVTNIDFINNIRFFNEVANCLSKLYRPGIHHLTISL